MLLTLIFAVMATIRLNKMVFHAPIGVFPEEKRIKNEIHVDLSIQMDTLKNVKNLTDSIDYSEIYSIVEKEILQERDLLEEAINGILNACQKHLINHTFNFSLMSIHCSIKKINPPIQGALDSVEIEDTLLLNLD